MDGFKRQSTGKPWFLGFLPPKISAFPIDFPLTPNAWLPGNHLRNCQESELAAQCAQGDSPQGQCFTVHAKHLKNDWLVLDSPF